MALTQLWSSMIRSRMLMDTGVVMRLTPAECNHNRDTAGELETAY